MRYAVTLTNDKGKIITLSGNEYLDIDIIVGNKRIAALTIREGNNGPAIYDESDHPVELKHVHTFQYMGETNDQGVKLAECTAENCYATKEVTPCKLCNGTGKVDIGFKDKADCHACNGRGFEN